MSKSDFEDDDSSINYEDIPVGKKVRGKFLRRDRTGLANALRNCPVGKSFIWERPFDSESVSPLPCVASGAAYSLKIKVKIQGIDKNHIRIERLT